MTNKITKSDLNKVYVRNLFGFQWGWNYESMQGLGYAFAFMPIIKRLYADKPQELKEALKTHTGFFNTTPAMSPLILGANAALEEKLGNKDEDAIVGLKTGLMGPFAGVGDTLFVAIYRAIVFSIAAYLAIAGNASGLIIPLLTGSLVMFIRYKFLHIGYKQGQKIAGGLASQMKIFTEAAAILGLTVVGALIASVITYKLKIEYTMGDVTLNVQQMLDRILPALVPLAIVGFSYWVLGKKNMNSTRLIFILIALGMVLGNLQAIFTGITHLFA